MHTDPIADMIIRIKNAASAHHTDVFIPFSKINFAICEILKKNNFILDYEKYQDEKKHPRIAISLNEKRSRINFKRVSKPGQRIYRQLENIKSVKSGYGIAVYSTSRGLMTDKEVRKNRVGGELLFEVF